MLTAAFFFVVTKVCAETETIDLKALAKKARPAVMLLVVSDATGKEIATGTGFLVSSDGKLITNHHVIENAASAVAKAENGGRFAVTGVLADDPTNDLVLLTLDGKDLPFLPLGKNTTIETGMRIAVIGSPLGLEGTVSEGIVSAVRELLDKEKRLQITAAVSHGSSGSPVLDAKGEVVGVATAILREGQSLNFAIPVDACAKLLNRAAESNKPTALSDFKTASSDEIRSSPEWKALMDAHMNAVMDAELTKLGAHRRDDSGKLDDAHRLMYAQDLVRKYPSQALAHRTLGLTYADLRFTSDAIASCQQAVKLDPNDAVNWTCLASVYLDSEMWGEGITANRQAVKLKPGDAAMWLVLGSAYERAGKTTEAIAAYRQAVKLSPKNGFFWAYLASVYHNEGKLENAINSYREALKHIPTGDTAAMYWSLLGELYVESGKMADAIDAYQQAIKLKPDDAGTWKNLGSAYRKTGRTDEADDAFRRAEKLKP